MTEIENRKTRIRQSRNGDVTLFDMSDSPLIKIQFFHGFSALEKEEKARIATAMMSILADETTKMVPEESTTLQ